jgi:hypothetical protein
MRARVASGVAWAVGCMLAAAGSPLAAGQYAVSLRGGEPDLSASAVTALPQGLEIRSSDARAGERRELIAWDLVRGISAGDASVRAPGSEMMPMAVELWRARIRIERGDAELARPLLERHRARYLGLDGPTAHLVWEGLLRSAVEAGDRRESVVPWLECLRLGSDGEASRFPSLGAVLDDSTGLLPSLPPFMPEDGREALAQLCERGAGVAVGDNPAVSRSGSIELAARVGMRLARVMRLAGGAVTVAGAASPQAGGAAPAEQALSLVEAIVVAADPRARAAAVAAFDRAFPEPPSFLASWRLAAIGAGAARAARSVADGEPRVAALESAAIELLAVPASGLDRTGLVDAYALEEAARLVREAGNEALAARLESLRDERLARKGGVQTRPTTSVTTSARTAAMNGTTN